MGGGGGAVAGLLLEPWFVKIAFPAKQNKQQT